MTVRQAAKTSGFLIVSKWAMLQKLVDFGNFCDFGEVGRRGSKIICICICTCFSPVEAAMTKIAQNLKNL